MGEIYFHMSLNKKPSLKMLVPVTPLKNQKVPASTSYQVTWPMRRQWLRYQIAVATCRNVGSTLVPSSGTPKAHPINISRGGRYEGKKNIQKLEYLLRLNIERMKYMAIMNFNHVFFHKYVLRNVSTQLHLSLYLCCYSFLFGKRGHSLPVFIAFDDFTST